MKLKDHLKTFWNCVRDGMTISVVVVLLIGYFIGSIMLGATIAINLTYAIGPVLATLVVMAYAAIAVGFLFGALVYLETINW